LERFGPTPCGGSLDDPEPPIPVWVTTYHIKFVGSATKGVWIKEPQNWGLLGSRTLGWGVADP